MIKELVIFAAGVYSGIYASQTYNIPRVDEPQKLLEKFQELVDSYKKKP